MCSDEERRCYTLDEVQWMVADSKKKEILYTKKLQKLILPLQGKSKFLSKIDFEICLTNGNKAGIQLKLARNGYRSKCYQFNLRHIGQEPFSSNLVDIWCIVLCSSNSVTEEEKCSDINVYSTFIFFPTRNEAGHPTISQDHYPQLVNFHFDREKSTFRLSGANDVGEDYVILQDGIPYTDDLENKLFSWTQRREVPPEMEKAILDTWYKERKMGEQELKRSKIQKYRLGKKLETIDDEE